MADASYVSVKWMTMNILPHQIITKNVTESPKQSILLYHSFRVNTMGPSKGRQQQPREQITQLPTPSPDTACGLLLSLPVLLPSHPYITFVACGKLGTGHPNWIVNLNLRTYSFFIFLNESLSENLFSLHNLLWPPPSTPGLLRCLHSFSSISSYFNFPSSFDVLNWHFPLIITS